MLPAREAAHDASHTSMDSIDAIPLNQEGLLSLSWDRGCEPSQVSSTQQGLAFQSGEVGQNLVADDGISVTMAPTQHTTPSNVTGSEDTSGSSAVMRCSSGGSTISSRTYSTALTSLADSLSQDMQGVSDVEKGIPHIITLKQLIHLRDEVEHDGRTRWPREASAEREDQGRREALHIVTRAVLIDALTCACAIDEQVWNDGLAEQDRTVMQAERKPLGVDLLDALQTEFARELDAITTRMDVPCGAFKSIQEALHARVLLSAFLTDLACPAPMCCGSDAQAAAQSLVRAVMNIPDPRSAHALKLELLKTWCWALDITDLKDEEELVGEWWAAITKVAAKAKPGYLGTGEDMATAVRHELDGLEAEMNQAWNLSSLAKEFPERSNLEVLTMVYPSHRLSRILMALRGMTQQRSATSLHEVARGQLCAAQLILLSLWSHQLADSTRKLVHLVTSSESIPDERSRSGNASSLYSWWPPEMEWLVRSNRKFDLVFDAPAVHSIKHTYQCCMQPSTLSRASLGVQAQHLKALVTRYCQVASQLARRWVATQRLVANCVSRTLLSPRGVMLISNVASDGDGSDLSSWPWLGAMIRAWEQEQGFIESSSNPVQALSTSQDSTGQGSTGQGSTDQGSTGQGSAGQDFTSTDTFDSALNTSLFFGPSQGLPQFEQASLPSLLGDVRIEPGQPTQHTAPSSSSISDYETQGGSDGISSEIMRYGVHQRGLMDALLAQDVRWKTIHASSLRQRLLQVLKATSIRRRLSLAQQREPSQIFFGGPLLTRIWMGLDGYQSDSLRPPMPHAASTQASELRFPSDSAATQARANPLQSEAKTQSTQEPPTQTDLVKDQPRATPDDSTQAVFPKRFGRMHLEIASSMESTGETTEELETSQRETVSQEPTSPYTSKTPSSRLRPSPMHKEQSLKTPRLTLRAGSPYEQEDTISSREVASQLSNSQWLVSAIRSGGRPKAPRETSDAVRGPSPASPARDPGAGADANSTLAQTEFSNVANVWKPVHTMMLTKRATASFKCPMQGCGFSAAEDDSLFHHVRLTHQRYICVHQRAPHLPICGRIYSHWPSLSAHRKDVHRDAQPMYNVQKAVPQGKGRRNAVTDSPLKIAASRSEPSDETRPPLQQVPVLALTTAPMPASATSAKSAVPEGSKTSSGGSSSLALSRQKRVETMVETDLGQKRRQSSHRSGTNESSNTRICVDGSETDDISQEVQSHSK